MLKKLPLLIILVGVVSLMVSSQFSIAEDYWVATATHAQSYSCPRYKRSGTGWNKDYAASTSGSCWAAVNAHYVDSDYHYTTVTSSSSSWQRKRYDWVGGGTPSPVTKNVSLRVTSSGTCTVDAKWWFYKDSDISAYIYSTAYATKSGGTPNVAKSGHAKINLSANYGSIFSNWSLEVSKAGPAANFTKDGSNSHKTYSDSGTAQVGGSLTFNTSGAQIHTSNSAYASASQNNGNYGYAYSSVSVNEFKFE